MMSLYAFTTASSAELNSSIRSFLLIYIIFHFFKNLLFIKARCIYNLYAKNLSNQIISNFSLNYVIFLFIVSVSFLKPFHNNIYISCQKYDMCIILSI